MMTNDQREAKLRARVAKILSRGDVVLGSDESLRRHTLPSTIAEIELGEKPETTNGIISNRSFADGLYPVLARWG